MTRPTRISLFLLAAVALGLGCDRDDKVTSYQAPKEPAQPQASMAEETASSSGLITWTLPAGWKEVQAPGTGSIRRYATIQVTPDQPDSVLTVLSLPRQPVLENVNRWEGQLGLPTSTEADLPKHVTQVQITDGTADVVRLDGAKESLLAALVPHEQQTWFLTLKAPAAVVDAQKSNFDAFVRSIHFGGQPQPSSEQSEHVSAAGIPGLAKFTTPPGWVREAQTNTMRPLSFRLGPSESPAEVIVARLPAGNFGDWLMNVNRWRGQVGLEPLADEAALTPPVKTEIGGKDGQLFEFTGARSAAGAKQMLVGFIAQGNDAWFFKLIGPAEVVAQQKPAFLEFLKSIQFE